MTRIPQAPHTAPLSKKPRRISLPLMLCLCFFLPAFSAKMMAQRTPLETAQAQLDAYNAQDIDAFAAVFAEDAEVYMNLGDTVPAMRGRAEIHARYGAMFAAHPDNKSILTGRMVQGNFVFDHEYITGRDTPLQIMAIYEVSEGKIARCWFVR